MHPDREYFRLIDEWIYLTPKSEHVVNAYCVFKDLGEIYLQLSESCDDYMNLFDIIAEMDGSWSTGPVPHSVQAMLFRFIIQMSHAMAFAHASGLTHNAFDLS
jgi:hypothetical protein